MTRSGELVVLVEGATGHCFQCGLVSLLEGLMGVVDREDTGEMNGWMDG